MARGASSDRLLAASQVVSMLLDRSFRESIPDGPAGKRPIMIASMDDRMDALLDRISSTGLPVALCVRGGAASMTVATIRETEAHEGSDSAPIHPDATVGMFISYLWVKGSFTFHLSEPVTVEYELEMA